MQIAAVQIPVELLLHMGRQPTALSIALGQECLEVLGHAAIELSLLRLTWPVAVACGLGAQLHRRSASKPGAGLARRAQ